jgi:hypothetical protein
MLAAWYLSGCRDGEDTGEYSLDMAMAAGEAAYKRLAGDYESLEVAEKEWEIIKPMIVAYHDWVGPGGEAQDYPSIRVFCDGEGKPLVERAWACMLTDGYIFTCRTDLIIYKRGIISTMDHKTSSVWGVKERKRSICWDPQFTGQYWVLTELFPGQTINGVEMNILPKERTKNSQFKACEREGTTRNPGQLERWRQTTINTLFSIDEAVNRFDRMMETGNFSLEYMANMCFPDRGTRNGRCGAYGGCEYWDLCRMAGMEERMMSGYRVRSGEELANLREWEG